MVACPSRLMSISRRLSRLRTKTSMKTQCTHRHCISSMTRSYGNPCHVVGEASIIFVRHCNCGQRVQHDCGGQSVILWCCQVASEAMGIKAPKGLSARHGHHHHSVKKSPNSLERRLTQLTALHCCPQPHIYASKACARRYQRNRTRNAEPVARITYITILSEYATSVTRTETAPILNVLMTGPARMGATWNTGPLSK